MELQRPISMSSPPQKKQKSDKPPKPETIFFPPDIVFHEILTRLPAKHVVRLRCVSPDWNSAISTTQFAAKHLLDSSSSSSSRSVHTLDSKKSFEALEYGDYPEYHDFSRFGDNFTDTATTLFMIGSANGLALLICSAGDYNNCLLSNGFYFVVYNPVLGKDAFIRIQRPVNFLELAIKDNFKTDDYSFGFGYSSIHDDYYIIALNFLRNPYRAVVYVYSLKTREWVQNEALNNQQRWLLTFQDRWFTHCGLLLKETLHWGITVTSEDYVQNYIAVFDLATRDKCKIMLLPYPKFGNSGGYTHFSLSCMDDCLCACQWGIGLIAGNAHSIWMLKEYGVYTSWTPLFRLRSYLCKDFFGYTKSRMVLVHFFLRGVLHIADFTRNSAAFFYLGSEGKRFAVNHVQSLVSPFSPYLKQRG